MSDLQPSIPLAYSATATPQSSPLVRLGGALGLAACAVGLLILLAACAGYGKALALSIVPLVLSLPGILIALVGAVSQRRMVVEDTHVLLALFVNALGLLGGAIELAVHRGWQLFPK